MNHTILLVGSLSNDLFRVAKLAQRNSKKAACRFLQEAKRWSAQLENDHHTADYIAKVVKDISSRSENDISPESAETYLMYGILLQNYTKHLREKKD